MLSGRSYKLSRACLKTFTFDQLLGMMRETNIIDKEESSQSFFMLHLRYFANFPEDDDVVTVFKWNLLLRLFGPMDSFRENFQKKIFSRNVRVISRAFRVLAAS